MHLRPEFSNTVSGKAAHAKGEKSARKRSRGRAPGPGLALCALFAAGGLSLAAEEFSRDGLRIEIVRATETAKTVVPGYSVFRVTAENPTAEARTLHAVIRLVWKDPAATAAAPKSEANCVAYLEIPARHRLTEAVPCKGDKFSSYEVEIKSVLPFILNRSPLKWQKAEALP